MSTWYALWRERTTLAIRCTPDNVMKFKPVGERDIRRPRLIRAIAPWAMKWGGFKLDQWIVRREGKLVGTLMIRADRTGNRSHEIRLSLDPEWQSQLAVSLLQFACQQLARIPAKGTLIEVGDHEVACLRHWLGTRVDRVMVELESKRSGILTA